MRVTGGRLRTALLVVPLGLAMTACAASGSSGGSSDTVKVGVISSQTGTYSVQSADFRNGLEAGLNYLTKGTNTVNGHKIEITYANDTGQASVGIAKAKSMIASGAKFLTGITDSSIAIPVAQQAVQNNIIYLPGGSASYQLTGVSPLVFGNANKNGSQIFQKLLGSGDLSKKKLAYVGQDYAYGQDTYTSLKVPLEQVHVTSTKHLLPMSTTNFTAVAAQIKAEKPDYIYSSWAGPGTDQLFAALRAQGVFDTSQFIGYLITRNTYASIGQALGPKGVANALFSLYYYPGFSGNAEEKFLMTWGAQHKHQVEYDDPTGWNAAAMIVHAIQTGGTDDTKKMAASLDDYTWTSPQGDVTMRAADHAELTPQFAVKLAKGAGDTWTPQLVKAYTSKEMATAVTDPIKR
jgi:branched-chain amino acid transport system substrate-binding protein